MKTESPAPLVSDEQIKPPAVWRANSWSGRMEVITPKGITPEEVRAIYEAHLSKMRAERDELVGVLRKADDELHRIAWAHTGEIRDGETNPMVSVLKSSSEILSKYKTE